MKEWYVKVSRRCDKCHERELGQQCQVCNDRKRLWHWATIEEFMSMMDDVRDHEEWMNQD